MQIKTNKSFLVLFIFGLFLFFIIKFYSYKIPENLYKKNSFDLLNKICGSESIKPFDFYLGKFEENISGPISSVISGILLLIFVYYFLRTPSPKSLGITIFIFLLITKIEVLFFPPYGDHAGGSLAEAVWLARNNFDYVGLFKQPPSIAGGPKFFFFSLYPGFIALLMKIAPSKLWFLISAHSINFALSAGIVSIFYSILLKVFDRKIAIFTSLLLVSLPLFQSMTEMINMEITCLFFSILTAKLLIDKKIALASMAAVISVFIKGSGAYACGMVFSAGLFLFLFDKKFKYKFNVLFWAFLCMFFAFLQVYLRAKFVHISDKGHNTVAFLCGLDKVLSLTYVFKFYLISLVTLVYLFINDLIKRKVTLNHFLESNYISIVMFLGSTMWYAQHINVGVMGPRYKLILAPFLLYGIVFAFLVFIKKSKLVILALFFAIIVSYFGSYGNLYPDRIESKYYAYGFLERSLEYRNDLKLHQKLAKEFETNFKNFTAGAPWITAHYLAFDEFGYVKKPLDVVLYGQTVTFGGIKKYNGLKNLDYKKIIWIGFQSDYPADVIYPIDPKDFLIKEIYFGDKKAALFMGGFAIEKIYRKIMLKSLYQDLNKKSSKPISQRLNNILHQSLILK